QAVMATTSEAIADARDVISPDVVKVVSDRNGRALYFSRSPIPYPRDLVRRYGTLERALAEEKTLLAQFRKHTGLYVYRRDFLLEFARSPSSQLEETESLEQLRALERGAVIKVVEAAASSIGVDTAEDLERVRRIMERNS
ncbi:MAG: 3-deoxy-manno-octulosonate cytidylyltransferase, partial [Pyrinomonadaceae bacterium]|nr:3-deoxy-manno-octulosonate cytidylyltransferase [Pyrinomonadaceae bacterium]